MLGLGRMNSSVDWTPVFISGSVLWLRGDLGVTGTTSVTLWADQSGKGNDAIPASGADPPSVSTNAINGKTAIAFAGGPSGLFIESATGWPTGNGTFSWVVVFKATDATAQQAVFCFGGGVGNDSIGLYMSLTSNYASMEWSGGVGYRPTTGTAIANNTFACLLATKAAGNVNATTHLYKNFAEWTGGTASDSTPNLAYDTVVANKHMALGAWDGYGLPLTGAIAELIIYSKVLSSSEITLMAAYISTRYGL